MMEKSSFKAVYLAALSLVLAACSPQPSDNAEVNQTNTEAVSSQATPTMVKQAQTSLNFQRKIKPMRINVQKIIKKVVKIWLKIWRKNVCITMLNPV